MSNFSHPVEVDVLDMTYNPENNVFRMKVFNTIKKEEITLAIKGTDWGVTPEVSSEIISDFCDKMIGTKRTLHIEEDDYSLGKIKSQDEKVSDEYLKDLNNNMDKYPLSEISYEEGQNF